MSKSARLRLEDFRAVSNLVGECRELGDDPIAWRSRFASELGRLAGAFYTVAMATSLQVDRLRPMGWSEWGEIDQKVSRQVQSEYTNLRFSPLIDGYLARRESADGAALSRTDLVGDREWFGSPFYRVIHDPLRLGPNLVSFLSLPGVPEECSGVMMVRGAAARRDFSAREKAMVREANAAIAPLIGGPLAHFNEPSPSQLPSRVREVLRCLLEGDGDKQIASRLRISPHTVNVHTKAIYRHFRVQSRTELLARWVRRGWGNRCAWTDQE